MAEDEMEINYFVFSGSEGSVNLVANISERAYDLLLEFQNCIIESLLPRGFGYDYLKWRGSKVSSFTLQVK